MAEEKTSFRYPNVSAGYVGINVEESTLSSRFFGLLFSGHLDLHKPSPFPQRIPKTGFFFEELVGIEGPSFGKHFFENITRLRGELKSTNDSQRIVNIAKSLLRLGETKSLIDLNIDKSGWPLDTNLQLRFVKESARANQALSNGDRLELTGLEQVVRESIGNVEPLRLIPLLAYYVALSFRFFKDKGVHSSAHSYSETLEGLLVDTPLSFEAVIAHSIAYRAIAIDYLKGKNHQQCALDRVIALIDAVTPSSAAETIAFLDNKLTASQTLSKWHGYQKDFDKAEHYIKAMTEFDPFDSTGFSELGIYLSSRGRTEEALNAFNRAVELGPPAVGMNHFFCGKTFLKLGDVNGACAAFEKAIDADSLAVSPHLELLAIQRGLGNIAKRAEISGRIISSPELSSQLESKEYDEVLNDSKIRVAV